MIKRDWTLKGLQHEVRKEIKGREQQDVKKAREQILTIAQEAGISVAELLASTTSRATSNTKQEVKPKYQIQSPTRRLGQVGDVNL